MPVVSADGLPLAPCDLDAAERLWSDYAAARPGNVEACLEHVVDRIGDQLPLVDELLTLIIDGRKRATCGLVADYVAAGDPLPRVGGHLIICDGAGAPRAILRSIELRIGPFNSVDASFAYDEGEGDRTLESWLAGHRRFFDRVSATRGATWSEDDEAIFERFDVVWPPELADRSRR